MKTLKAPPFTEEQRMLANFADALSHPARIAIVTLLQGRKQASCGEIVQELPLSQPTVSQHIKTLLDAGILLQEAEGPRMLYRLDCAKLLKFCHNFQCCIGTQTPES